MKTFFILLLLTNIVFALVQWLLPYEQLFDRPRSLVAAEQLRLLDEPDTKTASQIQASTIETQALAPTSQPGKLCYTLGPFKEQQQVQEIMARFRQNELAVKSRPSVEKEYLGVMVYIDGHETRDEARTTARNLAEKGIRDYMIVDEDNKKNALSLGIFGLKRNADRRVSKIESLGYDVQSELRYRNRTIYWLDYDQPENDELKRLVDKLKNELSVSRISRRCS